MKDFCRKGLLLLALACMAAMCACPALAQESLNRDVAGMLTSMNFEKGGEGRALDQHLVDQHGMSTEYISQGFKYYDNLTSLMLALEAGEVSSLSVPRSVAEYLVSRNEDLISKEVDISIPESYAMAVMKENQQLFDALNGAVKQIVGEGIIDQLAKEHITKVAAGAQPQVVEFPVFEGAPTITVALTGDMPPLDYVSADGQPAGFNLAMLAEIANRAQVNIETLVVENNARVLALTSGKADAIFWNRLWYCPMDDCAGVSITEVPAEVICTQVYYTDEYVPVFKK